MKSTDTGILVYCVGKDLADDGGNLKRFDLPGTDIGFTLLDPKHRRQPPPKPKGGEKPDE